MFISRSKLIDQCIRDAREENYTNLNERLVDDIVKIPAVRKVGQNLLRKGAKAASKKIGKLGRRAIYDTGKTILQSDEFKDFATDAASKLGKKAWNFAKDKWNQHKMKSQQPQTVYEEGEERALSMNDFIKRELMR